MFARYDYRFEMGSGGHNLIHGGAIFPDTLRWIWRDYPGVKGAGEAVSIDAVLGEWDVVVNSGGAVAHQQLTVTEQNDVLAATLVDKTRGEITVTAISFEDGILSYEYVPPKAQSKWGKKPGEKAVVSMVTWLKVTGDTFKGALMNGKDPSEINYDFSVTGHRK